MARRTSTRQDGRFTVSGPYEDERPAQNVGQGISLAQTLATRHRLVEGELTYYVRDLAGDAYARVTKQEDGIITTTPLAG